MKYDASEMFFCEERTCVVVRSKTVTKILSFTQVFPFFFMQDPFSKTTLYVMKVKQDFQEIAVCLFVFFKCPQTLATSATVLA